MNLKVRPYVFKLEGKPTDFGFQWQIREILCFFERQVNEIKIAENEFRHFAGISQGKKSK